jgi:hypothetical protein
MQLEKLDAANEKEKDEEMVSSIGPKKQFDD